MTSVSRLCETCIPLAIGGCVIAIVVDALNGQVFWSWSHIGEEIFKFVPAFANFNASVAIIFVIGCVGIFAATKHLTPYCVFRRFGPSNCRSVCTNSKSVFFTAAAGNRVAVPQFLAGNELLGSAVAPTQPSNMAIPSFFGCLQYGQAAEALARNVSEKLLPAAGPLTRVNVFGHSCDYRMIGP
jgi:hypothetical protein